MRPQWRDTFGPLDLPMPVDPDPTPFDWEAAYFMGQEHDHEDTLDRLNADRTWGTTNPAEYGGSGIVFGYAWNDENAVRVAAKAIERQSPKPDKEHRIRWFRWSMTAWEMTHETVYARKLVAIDNATTGELTDDPATVHLGDPGWVPNTLAQYHAMAQASPHRGLPWNGRELGWAAYLRAMRHKVDRTCGGAWANMLLETCALAAIPGTGQQVSSREPGLIGQTYTMHEGILIHGVLALCHRLHKSVPYWVFDWMEAVGGTEPLDYAGYPSPPKHWFTDDGRMVVPMLEADPAYGHWGSNCAALLKLTGDSQWRKMSERFGPQSVKDETSRQFTMLMRGSA